MPGACVKGGSVMRTAGTTERPSIGPRLVDMVGWNRGSLVYVGGLLLTLGGVISLRWQELSRFFWWWQPGDSFWEQVDWFLLLTLALLFLLVVRDTEIERDRLILVVGFAGGMALEGWGTGTGLWEYFTGECPPLWILPAWPIASLAIERASELLLDRLDVRRLCNPGRVYWLVFSVYLLVMLNFVAPFLDSPLTLAAVLVQLYLILTPSEKRHHLVYFGIGAAIGCLLEVWGTTRLCWTYYTGQTPPLFAIMAHGMAAVAFSRTVDFIRVVQREAGRVMAGTESHPNPTA